MTSLALCIVIVAAFLHATWNLCAKKAGGGLPFVYAAGLIMEGCYLVAVPIYLLCCHPHVPWSALPWACGSGLLKAGYSVALQRSYRKGDYSLVYPLVRGTGPLLATSAAIVFFGERPPLLALLGAGAIVFSIFAISGGHRLFHDSRAHLRSAVGHAVLTGCFIAAFTLWDRHGVAALHIPPIVYEGTMSVVQMALLTPFAVARWAEVRVHWREHFRYVLGVAVLSPTAYILILTALSFTEVSYIAPAREISVVIAAFIGVHHLKEADARRRLWAAATMTAGIVALAIA